MFSCSDCIIKKIEGNTPKKNFHLVDGGNLIVKPWEELTQESLENFNKFYYELFIFSIFLKIADFLGIDKKHFSKERFQQRSDGYYCILKPNRYYNLNVTKLKCLGDNKGRSAKKDRIKKYTHKY